LKILVTGGAGFIGSHIVEALVARGHRVRVLDDFSSGHPRNLAAVRGKLEILRGDCSDPRIARRAVRGIRAVFHEAAIPSVTRSVLEPAQSHRANATGTLTMLVAARDAGVERFVYASSSSIYGETPGLPKRETQAPSPLSPYAVAKLVGEHYLRVFCSLYGMQGLALRYFNVFGPRQDPGSPYSGVISLFTSALLAGRTPVIYGDGRQSRDFTYVANVVDGNLLALEAKNAKGQGVNLATGRRITLLQLLKTLASEIGRPAEAIHKETRAGDIRHSLADVKLAKRVLGYRPSVSFEDGLRETVAWYRSAARAGSRR
jgi:UDP-glucose 4-epimerase